MIKMVQMTQNGSHKGCWKKAVLLSAVIVAVYLFMASTTTLWDRDESRFARAASEMAQSGNFLYPTFNGEVRAHKPAGVYWLMALGIRFFGINAFGARFFSAIASGGLLLLVYRAGSLLAGPRAGLWSIAVMATAAMTPIFSTAATADSVLMFFMMAVMVIFIQQVHSRPRPLDLALMSIALGLALLVKGPVALLTLAIIWLSLLFGKKVIQNRLQIFFYTLAAFVIAVGIFLAWAIPANNATGGAFFEFGFMNQFVHRIMHPMESHGGDLWKYLPYYPGIVLVGFFPWTLLLPAAIRASWKDSGQISPLKVILFTWIISVIIIMTLVATKLPHYILFTWPAFSIAVGFVLSRYEPGGQDIHNVADRKNSFRGGLWLYLPVGLPLSLAMLIGPWFGPLDPEVQILAAVSGLILLITLILAAGSIWELKVHKCALVLIAGTLLLFIPICAGLLPLIDRWKITPPVVRILDQNEPDSVPIAAYDYAEPSLHFYLNQPVEEITGGEAALRDWARRPGRGYLIISQRTMEKMDVSSVFPPERIENISSVKGFNFTWGIEMTVHVLERTRP